MITRCFLKGVVAVFLICVRGHVCAQDDILVANPAKQQTANGTDSLQQRPTLSLLSFTGNSSTGQNTLTWKTDSRSHFTSFTLERGADESHFTPLGEVTIANDNHTNSFTYTDSKPTWGRNFYRLKMTDSSGKQTYSSVVAVVHSPVTDLQISFDSPSATVGVSGMLAGGQYQLKVYNSNGQIALQKAVTKADGSISISNLPHGLYVVYATDGLASTASRKIIW